MSIEGEVRKILEDTGTIDIDKAERAILKLTNLKSLDEKEVEEFLRNTEPYKWWDTHLGKLAKDISSHFSKPDLKPLEIEICKCKTPQHKEHVIIGEHKYCVCYFCNRPINDNPIYFSKPIKYPEKKGILSREDFNTMSDEAYALKQERNIGYNQAIDEFHRLNMEGI